jgi:hypothetical protein
MLMGIDRRLTLVLAVVSAGVLHAPLGVGGGMGAALDASSLLDQQALEQLVKQPVCAPVCPQGYYATPKLPVVAHRPQANGCGPQSNAHAELGSEGRYQVKEPFGLIGCCNAHDLCFSTCGMAFEECEERFERCMEGVCSVATSQAVTKSTDCRGYATRFAALTREFGCSFHRSSVHGGEDWAPVCECTPTDQVAARMSGWLTEFHKEYGSEVEQAPVPTLDPTDNRLLLWNLTVRYAETYVRWVEKLDHSEMVVLDHNHADKISQKQKNDDSEAPPDLTMRVQSEFEVPPSSQQREKPTRPKSFPEHWGAPPMIQTKDLRPLPAGYGRGSNTLSKWIKQKLREDEIARGSESPTDPSAEI